MGYLPETKSANTKFNLSIFSNDNTDLYVSDDGLTIYYSSDKNSSEKIDLVTVENKDGKSELKLFADNISEYRLIQQNINAFNSFSLNASCTSNSKTFTKTLTVKLSDTNNSSLVEMYKNKNMTSSFKENWEKVRVEELVTSLPIENRYPQLPNSKTEMNSPFATLVNYGEYQLLLYTSIEPKYISGSLNFDSSVNIEVWRYYNKNWIFENYVSELINGSIELPMKANLTAIDFLNYDLKDSYSKEVVLEANKTYEDGSPKLKTIKIPQLVSSDAYHYIFVNNSIGFYAFTSSETITAEGNDLVKYPESGQWYALIQNTWVKLNKEVANMNSFDSTDRYSFEKALRFTNDNNSAWTNVEPWESSNWSSTVDYFRYIPIYSATSGYNYIIYETDNGFESLEFSSNITGGITVTEDGLKFANSLELNGNGYNGIILKKYDGGYWTAENNDIVSNYIYSNSNGEYFFNRPGAINSIIYSNRDILDINGNVVISNMFSQSLIVSNTLSVADLSCKNPVSSSNEINIGGVSYPYVVLTQETIEGQTTYVAYISNNELKYTTASTTGYDIVANNYPLTIYKQIWDVNKNKWMTPTLVYEISEDAGIIDSLTKTYTEVSNGVVSAIYNQYPNGRVDKYDSTMSEITKQQGHFILELKQDMSNSSLPENAYEVFFDREGNEHIGPWTWKWSDTQTELLDYYCTPDGTEVKDSTRKHRYYKMTVFEAGGNVNEFVSSGEYLNFYGLKTSMGYKDLLGNWFDSAGVVVTPNGNYGYYDKDLNIVSTRAQGQYYFTVEDNLGNIVSESWDVSDEINPGEITSRVTNICNADNIKWINRDIAAYENVSISYEEYADVTFLDSSVDAILGDFINPEKISSSLEYISPQITGGQSNYWITFFDSCGSILNPFANEGKGKVAKDLEDLIFYVPNFGNVQKIFSGQMSINGIAFDVSNFSPEKEILKSETNWYTETEVSNDILNPVINALYMVNHTLKIDATDPGAFATIFDNQGNVKYKEYLFDNVDVFYRYITSKEYNKSLIKDASDADETPYFKNIGNKNYKMVENNNLLLLAFDLDSEGNTIQDVNGRFKFEYLKVSDNGVFVDLTTKVSISGVDSSTNKASYYLSIPRYVEINGSFYYLSEDYQILDDIVYRQVESNDYYEQKVSIISNEPRESFNIYYDGTNDKIDTKTEYGLITIENGKYVYKYEDISIELVMNTNHYFKTSSGENWGVLLSDLKETINNEEVYSKIVTLTTYNEVKEQKYLVPSEYICEKVSFTRLLKKLSDEEISRLLNKEENMTWASLVSTNDNKGLYQYYDKGNSPWEGFNVESLSGYSIGDDGYLYQFGNKVPAEITYDENGNEVSYDVSGVSDYYITVEEDFYSDIAFSYVDLYGENISISVGQRVPAIDKFGNKTTIPLDNNTFMFPVDQESGKFKFNAYVVDGAGNKSTAISGPWSIERKNLNTKNWEEFFVAGSVTNVIKNEIETAIEANTSDTQIPKITGVFLYKGNLYIVAIDEDDKETGAKASGIGMVGKANYLFNHTIFENLDNTTLKERSYYADNSHMIQKLGVGTKLDSLLNVNLGQQEAYFETFKDSNGDILTSELDLSVFDIAENQSNIIHVEISEDKNNSVLYGNVSQTIYEMLLEERNKEGQEDKIAPIIKSIYTLENVLYVEAEDNLGISSYGYKWVLDSIMPVETSGLDDNGDEITIKAGADIPKGTIIWHGAAQQGITVPTKMIIYVEDIEGNASYETVVISSGNQILYGEVSEEIKDKIEGAGGESETDNVAPIIENVYTYKGNLYVEGFDGDNNLATWCYGFNPLDNMSLKTDYQGYNAAFSFINIPAGTTIKANQQIYKKINSQEINIPMNITVSMRDSLGLETSETYYIFKDNYVYKGTAPEDLKDEIEKPSGGDENPSVTPTPGGGEDIPTPTPTPGPLSPERPIPVPDDFDEIDWTKYDFMFEILDKDTNRVVYKIIQDEASAIDCPRLENSVLYKYKMSAINEETGETLVAAKGEIRMTDTIAPTITKIWYSKNRIYVSAYDLGGFDDKPFNFMIEGSRDSADKFISNNNTVVLSGETVQVKVRDAAGNTATAKVEINEKTKDILYESLNPKEYLYINSSETKSLAYWFAYINTTYGIDVSNSYLSEKNKSENVSFEIKNNNVYIDLKGDGVISFYDNKTNKYLALNLRTLNTGKSYRSIVVQTTSEIDVSLAFKNKLLEQFGTIDGLSWYADGTVLSRIGSRVAANQTGVGTIKFVHDGKEMNAYILVADSISGTKTSCDFEKENFAYTYFLKDKVSFRDALRLPTPATKEDIDEIDFIVMEDVSQGVIRKGNDLRFSSPGLKTLELINCVNDELGEIKFEVISLTPYISKFTDIIGSDARADIEMLCEKGFVGDYPDEKYKPVNKMTTKEFLTMVNKIKMTYDSDFKIDKVFTSLNLSEKDFDYYSSQNVLINMSQTDVDKTIGTYTLNKAITFEEVVKLISATLLYDKYHNEEGIEAPESLSECAQEAIHLISMGIIDEKEERNATRELTRAEIAYLLTKTIKFLEL